MTHRVFITGSGLAPDAHKILIENGCVCRTGAAADSATELLAAIRDFQPDAIIVRQGYISDAVQDASPGLKVIAKHGVGLDNIDIEAATSRGIVVTYTPDVITECVAEHTLGLIFSLVRSICFEDRRIKSGVFSKKSYSGGELFGKTLGLIGFGNTARRVAELVTSFSMSVLAFHPSATVEKLPAHIRKVSNLLELVEQSDIISIHAPLTLQTKNLIDKEMLERMKSTAFLVNTSRGQIINESDLINAIDSGQIAGAALDCFSKEPLPPDSPLLSIDRIVMTPHVAGMSDVSILRVATMAVHSALAILGNRDIEIERLANPEVIGRQK